MTPFSRSAAIASLVDGDVGVRVPLPDVPAAGHPALRRGAGARAAHERRQAGDADRRRAGRRRRRRCTAGRRGRRWPRCGCSASSTGSGRSSRPALRSTPATSSRHCVARGGVELGGQRQLARGPRARPGPARQPCRGAGRRGVLSRAGRWDSSSGSRLSSTARRAEVSPGAGRRVRAGVVAPGGGGARRRPPARAARCGRAAGRRSPIARSSTSKVPRCRSSGGPPPCVPSRARAIGMTSANQPKSSPPMLCGDRTTWSLPTVSSAAARISATARGSLTTGGHAAHVVDVDLGAGGRGHPLDQRAHQVLGALPGVPVQHPDGAAELTALRDRVGRDTGVDRAPDQRHPGARVDLAGQQRRAGR